MRWLIVLLFFVGGCTTLAISADVRRSQGATLSMLDIGQGDSLLIDAGLGVMVDTGNPGSGALEQARALGVTVAALVLTHLHDDHAGDAAAIIRAQPAAVFWNGKIGGVLYEKVREAAKTQGVPLVRLSPGDVLHAGDASIRVLGPTLPYRTSGDPNDTSLVLRADLPGFSALLTGDAGLDVEKELPEAMINADVLKVAHHGSKTASGAAFLDAVSPSLALLSSGKENRYGHPSPEALGRLTERRIPVMRTDESGIVTVSATNGILAVATTSVH